MINFFRNITRNWLWSLFSLGMGMIIILGAALIILQSTLPDTRNLAHVQLQVPLRILSADNKLIATFGNKRRIPVSINEIPQQLINGVIATEDQRYFEHPGVDWLGVLRAAKAVITSGKKVQGASTITMQVARNFFLTRKKTYSRKITEIMLALKINHEFSKKKILELYLNKVYLGNRAYGVAACAQVYYGKNLDELTLPEIAMIAGLPQAPSSDNPLKNPKGALKRRNHVLERMLEEKYINQTQYQNAIKAPISAAYHAREVEFKAPYIAEEIRQRMIKKYGKEMAYNGGLIVKSTIVSSKQLAARQSVTQGLIAYSERHGFIGVTKNLGSPTYPTQSKWIEQLKKIPSPAPFTTAAVWELQDQAATVLTADGSLVTINWPGLKWARKRLDKQKHLGRAPQMTSDILKEGDVITIRHADLYNKNSPWQLSQIPRAQAALISVNPKNGAIESMIGGFNFNLNKFNRATQAKRQPGSVFKPFIYSAALDKGYTLASLINDAPIVIADSGENTLWRPHNVNLRFYGPTTLSVGLSQSRNLVSIRLLKNIGIDFALQYSKRFGFDPTQLPNSLSLALGSATLTPLQIAKGYSVFANGGFEIKPHLIEQITQDNGTVLYQNNAATACYQCLDTNNPDQAINKIPTKTATETITAQNAYLMNHAMLNIIRHGTGHAALKLKRDDLAGKTGSTNKKVDAWFAGFNHSLVSVVWVGFDDFSPLQEYGAQAALPIWIEYMGKALKGTPSSLLPKPKHIINMRIDPKTGLLARPGQNNAIFELFRQQYAPRKTAPTPSTSNDPLSPYNTPLNNDSDNTSPPTSEDDDSDPPLF